MALLTDDIQDKLIELLVNEGLIEKPVIDDALSAPLRVVSRYLVCLVKRGCLIMNY